MARYPTFEEYEPRGNFGDGIKRCDELLQKRPDDIQLLTTKFRLLSAASTPHHGEADTILDHIASLPTVPELENIVAIEDAVVHSCRHIYPPIPTAGPQVAKLWSDALKAAPTSSPTSQTHGGNNKLDFISTRWERAVYDNRVADMQHTLIQLKALQPRNRAVYMAHAALTQMLSVSAGDMQGRLAAGLARKAVREGFGGEGGLDCRVPGQILGMQGCGGELEGVGGSKVGLETVGGKGDGGADGDAGAREVLDPASVPANEWLSAEIGTLKRQFASLVQADASPDVMRSFAMNAIRLFHAATTALSTGARRSPADACFLAVSALVKLFEQTTATQYLLHAAYLSETLLTHNAHIHEARLILVYLYMRLSLGSLATHLFDSLNVKEIQHDTIGHALFTRLSLLHPHPTLLPTRKKDAFDPLKRAGHALGVYVRCEDRLAETEANVLSHGQTGMLFDLHALRESLRRSLTRRIVALEWRRTARLMRNVCEESEAVRQMGPSVLANWMEGKDNRDFDAAFDYGFNVERALHGCEGTVPGEVWVVFALVADMAWCIATGNPPPVLIETSDVWTTVVERAKRSVDPQTPAQSQASGLGMTAPEYLAGDLAHHTLNLLLRVHPASTTTTTTKPNEQTLQQEEAVSAIRSAMETLNIDSLTSSTPPDPMPTSHLLDHYAYADALRTVIAACEYVGRKQAVLSSSEELQVEPLQKRARALSAALQRHATEQQARVRAATMRQMMAGDEGVWTALQRFGGEGLDAFCEDVARSAREGWEGVGKIKLPQ